MIEGQVRRKVVFCACCHTPVAEWQGDVLVILGRHHMERHVTVLSPKDWPGGGLDKTPQNVLD